MSNKKPAATADETDPKNVLLAAVDKLGMAGSFCDHIKEFAIDLEGADNYGERERIILALQCIADRVRADMKEASDMVESVRLSQLNTEAEEAATRR